MSRPSRSRTALVVVLVLALGLPAMAAPPVPAGAYLAARQASYAEDFATAATQFDRLLQAAPGNPRFLESALIARVGLGQMDAAADLARALTASGVASRPAGLILLADDLRAGDHDAALDRIAAGAAPVPMAGDLVRAWALFGAGRTGAALAAFDEGLAASAHAGFRGYHKAVALALTGQADAALAQLAADPEPAADALAARAELLAETGRAGAARDLLDAALARGDDPLLRDLRARLAAGEAVTFDRVRDPAEAIGGVFQAIASVMARREPGTEALVHARIAQALAPRDAAATVLVAEILEDMGRLELAAEAYAGVDRDSPFFVDAEIGRASTLYAAGREDAAIEVLDALVRARPGLSQARIARGNLLRRLDRHAEAAAAFDAAIARLPQGQPVPWGLHYARGMAYERAGDWDAAEADFTRALEIEPDQPDVLNYLGYSLLERRERLDAALGMIETAVAARPEAGHIVDSLGWALYRLGRYDAAVAPMERAVELLPVDPVVNDHLGDVYWMVGRAREARFQWRRALSFDPEDADAARIRAKLARGLDAVRAEEGDPVLTRNDN